MPLSLVSLALNFLVFLAQDVPPENTGDTAPSAAGGAPGQGGGSLMQMLPFIVMIGVFMWFVLVRPQKQKETEEKKLLDKLKKNDHVVTKGGLHGVVMNVKDDEVVLRIDEQQNVKVRFQKNAIAAITGEDDKAKATEEKKA